MPTVHVKHIDPDNPEPYYKYRNLSLFFKPSDFTTSSKPNNYYYQFYEIFGITIPADTDWDEFDRFEITYSIYSQPLTYTVDFLTQVCENTVSASGAKCITFPQYFLYPYIPRNIIITNCTTEYACLIPHFGTKPYHIIVRQLDHIDLNNFTQPRPMTKTYPGINTDHVLSKFERSMKFVLHNNVSKKLVFNDQKTIILDKHGVETQTLSAFVLVSPSKFSIFKVSVGKTLIFGYKNTNHNKYTYMPVCDKTNWNDGLCINKLLSYQCCDNKVTFEFDTNINGTLYFLEHNILVVCNNVIGSIY